MGYLGSIDGPKSKVTLLLLFWRFHKFTVIIEICVAPQCAFARFDPSLWTHTMLYRDFYCYTPPRKTWWQWNIHHLMMYFLLNMGSFQCDVSSVYIDFLQDTTVCIGFAGIFSISHVCSFTGVYFSESWHGTLNVTTLIKENRMIQNPPFLGRNLSCFSHICWNLRVCKKCRFWWMSLKWWALLVTSGLIYVEMKWFVQSCFNDVWEQQRSSETSNLKHPQKPGLQSWRKKLWGIRIQSYNHLLGYNHRKALLPSNFCGVKKTQQNFLFSPWKFPKCQLFTGDVWLAVIVTCVVVVVITGRWFLLVKTLGVDPSTDSIWFHIDLKQLPPNTLVICCFLGDYTTQLFYGDYNKPL